MSTELVLLSRAAYRDREITGPRLRGLFALLAGDLRSGCGTARLLTGLWPDEQPENPAKALQILVSRARAQVGAEVIARTPTGYRLTLREDQVDAAAVLVSAAASARHASAGAHLEALAYAEAGLALWDGTTGGGTGLGDVGPDDTALGDPLAALRAARMSTYRSLVRTRALALARLGRHAEAVEALAAVVRERPRDEEVPLELLRADAATVGPSAALASYEAYRRALRDELGSDPGEPLQAEYRQLLRGAAPVIRRGVQHEPNALLGRDDDLAAVATLLRTSRVVSIVGPGGLGKTRLAHAVSRQAAERIVHVVALAGVSADDDVVGEVASALGVGETRRTPVGHPSVPADARTGIVDILGPAPALLVLDNCEHLIRGVAELVRALVSMTGDLRVLTTSRTPLGLSSESVYLLPELDLRTTAELFGQRATAARPGVELPAEVVRELCRHLDGLPLAAELAAARTRAMSVPEIARRLEDRFSLLRGGSRDAPERHHTLHAVVGWSWNLLDPAGQAAMRALSVFPGGFTADAVRHLVDGDHLRMVEHLVDQSLLKVADTPSGVRFRMLETVREFSTAERERGGEQGQHRTSDRAVDGFLAWAREVGLANHESPLSVDPAAAVARIRAEQDNLAQALRYGLARADGATVAATTAMLAAMWTVGSSFARLAVLSEETAWLLSHYRPAPEFVEVTRTAAALCTAAGFALHGPRATRWLILLRRLPPAPPDTVIRALAVVLCALPDDDPAVLSRLCDSDEPLLAGIASGIDSYVRENLGDQAGALKAAERMVAAVERRESVWMRVQASARLAELHMLADHGAEAFQHLRAALLVQEGLETWTDAVQLRWGMVLVCLQIGAVDEAERWLEPAGAGLVEDTFGHASFDLAVRGELMLARGEIEVGLGLWRRAVESTPGARLPGTRFEPGMEPWALELKTVAVVAHAQHGRLDLVQELLAELPPALSALLAGPVQPGPGLRLCGALLLALAMTDLDRGGQRGIRSGVRLVALAERFRYLRQFQPTMSVARARQAAEHADRSAYADAVASYADLEDTELRAAALAALHERT